MIDQLLDLSGLVLAGGESRRMGRPKALLMFEGETLLERQVRLLRKVSRRVAVVGAPGHCAGLDVPVLADLVPDCGPLGGIYTGLASSSTDYNFFIGCDMPFLTARFLRWVARRALASTADVTVPESREGELNPLAAVYRREVMGAIRSALEKKEYSVRKFFPQVRCLVVRWPELARSGFSPRIFDNLNTPADYEAAIQRPKGVQFANPEGTADE
jgi:molybdenum cofactor guanylyltransferase